MKIKKGDQVMVITGNYKGKKGKVEKVFPKLGKVLIPGINIAKKHVKSQGKERPGGIIDLLRPMAISKIALICPKCQKPTRVGYLIRNQDKIRICRKCQTNI